MLCLIEPGRLVWKATDTYFVKYQIFTEFQDTFLPCLINGDIVQKDPGDGFFLNPDNPERCFLNLFAFDPGHVEVIELGRKMIPAVTMVVHPENEHGVLAGFNFVILDEYILYLSPAVQITFEIQGMPAAGDVVIIGIQVFHSS